jgi:hypothetical protein
VSKVVQLIGLAGVVGLSLVADGCGGSSGSGAKVAQVDSTQTTTTGTALSGRSKREALVAFSACMREHGVPKFPDPVAVGNGMRLSFGSENGIDPNAPQFKRAERACRALLPNGGKSTPQEQAKHMQEALAYAACIRKHGVPSFPDPKASRGGGIEWGDLGVDPASPVLRAAEQACWKLVPGGPPPGENQRGHGS